MTHAVRKDGTEYIVHDDAAVLQFFAEHSDLDDSTFVNCVASNEAFWGENLTAYPGFAETVTKHLAALKDNPVAAVRDILIG